LTGRKKGELRVAPARRYNIPGVIKMTARVQRVMQEIDQFTKEELAEFLKEFTDKLELFGMLKTAESTFSDWDNEVDAAYDNL